MQLLPAVADSKHIDVLPYNEIRDHGLCARDGPKPFAQFRMRSTSTRPDQEIATAILDLRRYPPRAGGAGEIGDEVIYPIQVTPRPRAKNKAPSHA